MTTDAVEVTGRVRSGAVDTSLSYIPLSYSPYDYAVHEDPFPIYARLRAEAPVYHNAERAFWALSRHGDVAAGFRDATRLSSSHGVSLEPSAAGPNAARTMSFIAMDPPLHTRMRGVVSRAFTPRRVAEMEPYIRRLAVGHIEAALEEASASATIDFVDSFAGLLPMDVISEMIGVPAEDRVRLRGLADRLVHRDEGVFDVPAAGIEAAFVLAGYYADLIAERRRRPADDLVSALLAADLDGAGSDGGRLSDDEIISFLFLLVVAGNETTTKLLSNCWYWAWRNPEQRATPFADASRIPDWVEETLRYDTSTHMLARLATCDIELHDTVIPAGDRVLLLIGSANRDDSVFRDADRYDLDRDATATLSFGLGRHYCLGASLARLESRVALEELVARVADYDIDEAGAERVHSINVRGFAHLPTVLQPR